MNRLSCLVFIAVVSAQEGPGSVLRGTQLFQTKLLVSGLVGRSRGTPTTRYGLPNARENASSESTPPPVNGVWPLPSTKLPQVEHSCQLAYRHRQERLHPSTVFLQHY